MVNQEDHKKNIHTISLFVSNKPGVLVRIALVFSRRGYNIDSLVVSPAFDARFSRMTVTAQGDPEILDQIIKQAAKLVDVIHVGEHTDEDAVHCELALIKVKSTSSNKVILNKLIKKYHARVIDSGKDYIVIEKAGITAKLNEFELLLKKYTVLEMVRSGKIVMAKGRDQT
ncbi:MAG: acetolactate synthase small subunit [Candidatus Omnitrophica bacterium]|nr:acetolactate synthase small subunit [Candidatus Omnitrophota bacterium]